MNQKTGTIEVVIYDTKANFSDDETKEALLTLNNCVKSYPGFISRKLCKNEQGKWMDLVYWSDKTSALKASEDIMKNPVALKIFEMIDEEGMQMFHFDVLDNFSEKLFNQTL